VYRKWTDWEEGYLEGLMEVCTSYSQITSFATRRIKRSKSAIRKKAQRMIGGCKVWPLKSTRKMLRAKLDRRY
jgi:hypothetical protein